MAKKKEPTKNSYRTGEQPTDKKTQGIDKPKFKLSAKSFSFLSEPRTLRIIGLFCILLSLFLFISFISFLFSWQDDQSALNMPTWSFLMDKTIHVENALGKFGAIVAHWLMYSNFGIAAFFIVAFLFCFGFKIGFGIKLLPLGRFIRNSIFNLIFVPLLFGYLFHNSWQVLGGDIGFQLSGFLLSLIGSIGTAFLIFFIGLSYIIIAFNPDFNKLFAVFVPKGERDAEPEVASARNSFAEKIKSAELVDEEKPTIESTEVPYPEFDEDDDEYSDDDPSEGIEIKGSEDELFEDSPDDEEVDDEDDFPLEIEPKVEEASIDIIGSEEELAGDGEQEPEIEITNLTQEKELSEKEVDRKLAAFGEFDPTLELSSYKSPSIELLHNYETDNADDSMKVEDLEMNKKRIVETLRNYSIGIQSIKATIGPTVTLYEIVPEAGIRISKIKNLEDDIALSLAAHGIRIIAPIPGKGTIGIEVPNSHPDVVAMRTLIKSEKFQNSKYELPIALGKTISNETFVADLAKMPHLLMAGATGQGKSVGLNAILVSLLYKKHPSQIKFVLVDPKKVELSLFNKIERHFLAKLPEEEEAIITDTQKVVKTLNSLCIEMDARYELLKDAGVRNLKEYNAKFISRRLNPENGHKYLPYIILVVDEFADLIMTAGKEVEMPIARLAQLARAIGIHLIIATQRPSVNIITGTIKANFPARIAFRVTSKIDSRTILDSGGADQLIGRGDMLFSTGNDLIRIQCGFVDTPEVDAITDFIGGQRAYPEAFMLPEVPDDENSGSGDFDATDRDALFEDAARVIVMHQQGSASLLQRKLKLGYNRAGRIVDQLEAAGIIGQFEGSKARKVLIQDEISLEQFLKDLP